MERLRPRFDASFEKICTEVRKIADPRVSDTVIKKAVAEYTADWLASHPEATTLALAEGLEEATSTPQLLRTAAQAVVVDRGFGGTKVPDQSGRPLPGDPLLNTDSAVAEAIAESGIEKRPRGRPKGSKNRPKKTKEASSAAKATIKETDETAVEKRLTTDGKIVEVVRDRSPKSQKRRRRGDSSCSSSDSEPKTKPRRKAKSKTRAEIAKARAKANAWWKKHPRAKAADKRRTAKRVVKKARSYVPRRNDFRGVDTKR